MGEKKYLVLRKIGKFDPIVVNVFEDKQKAITFTELLRESEVRESISYFVAEILDV